MTTVAWDQKVLAVDSLITRTRGEDVDILHVNSCEKMFLMDDGCVFTWCGPVEDGWKFMEWYNTNHKNGTEQPYPKVEGNFTGLLLRLDGTLAEYWDSARYGIVKEKMAFGAVTGSLVAIGAMMAGAGAIDAVRIAMKRCPYTGGEMVMAGKIDEKNKQGSISKKENKTLSQRIYHT